MSCAGSNLGEVKANCFNGVKQILESNGGTMSEGGIVTMGETNPSLIKNFLDDTLGSAAVSREWFTEENGKIKYQFPKEVAQRVKEGFKFNNKLDRYEQQVIAETRALNEVSDVLFSPILYRYNEEEIGKIMKDGARQLSDSQTDTPNFSQWTNQTKAYLRDVKKEFEKFQRTETKGTEFYNNKTSQYQTLILRLEDSIKKLQDKPDSQALAQREVQNEISRLWAVLETLSIEGDVFQFERRLDTLLRHFNNRTIDGMEVDKDSTMQSVFLVYANQDTLDIARELDKLRVKYDSKMHEIVQKLITDNALIKQYAEEGKLEYTDPETGKQYTGEEALERMKTILETPKASLSWLGGTFLGSVTGGKELGSIARILTDVAYREKQGQVAKRTSKIGEHIGRFVRAGGNVSMFEQEDENGVKTGRLVHKFSNKWFEHRARSNKDKEAFKRQSNAEAAARLYGKYIRNKKENEEMLDFRKLEDVRTALKGYFHNLPALDKAEAENYKRELIARLGKHMYNEIIKEQVSKLEAFLEFSDYSYREFSNEVNRLNPLKFLEHFNSPNATQAANNWYLLDDYNVSIPLTEDKKGNNLGLYSEQFKGIEENTDAFEVWKNLEDLYRNFINPALREDNFYERGDFDLAKYDNYMKSSIFRSMSWYKKGLPHLINLWNQWAAIFGREKISDTLAKTPKTSFDDSLKAKANVMYETLLNKSLLSLIEKAEQTDKYVFKTNRGPVISEERGNELRSMMQDLQRIKTDAEEVMQRDGTEESILKFEKAKLKLKLFLASQKKQLAESISNAVVYARADIDIIDATTKLAEAVAASEASKQVFGTLNFLRDMVRNRAEHFENTDKKNEALRAADFLESWVQINLLRNKNYKESKGMRAVSGAEVMKSKSKSDKMMLKFLESEVKNLDEVDNMVFEHDGITYKVIDGEVYVIEEVVNGDGSKTNVEVPIETEENYEIFQEAYAGYLGKKMEKYQGHAYTVGSLSLGVIGNVAKNSLAVNLSSGAMNRMAGIMINRTFAASGRYGFNSKDLWRSKRFLSGVNIDRYASIIGLKNGFKGADHTANIGTFKLFVNSFSLIQNKYNEIDGLSGNAAKEGFSMYDFAIDNAEFHNQGELHLSYLQNQFVYDTEGNPHPIFDGETHQFIYKPGTLILRDEFRDPNNEHTKDNVRIWENFETSRDGNNPHLPLFFNMQANVERSQGNYNPRDRASVMGSTVGRALMLFKRFMPEQIFNSYGEIGQDLVKGGGKYEGRYRVMLKYAPTAALITGAMGFMALGPVGGIAGALGAGGLAVFLKGKLKRHETETGKAAFEFAEQFKTTASVLVEILQKVVQRPFEVISRGRLLSDTNLGYKLEEGMGRQVTEERKILSECVEDVSNLASAVVTTQIALLAGRMLFNIIKGYDDDDDNIDAELLQERAVEWEYHANKILNFHNNVVSDVTRVMNPMLMMDDTKPALINVFNRGVRMVKDFKKFTNGETEFTDPLKHFLKLPIVPMPTKWVNLVFEEHNNLLEDPKVYSSPWWNEIKDNEEEKAKKYAVSKRKQVRKVINDRVMEIFKEDLKNLTKEQESTLPHKLSDRIKMAERYSKIIVEMGMKMYSKKPYESNLQFNNKTDWDKQIEEWKAREFPPISFMTMKGWYDKKTSKNENVRKLYEIWFNEHAAKMGWDGKGF